VIALPLCQRVWNKDISLLDVTARLSVVAVRIAEVIQLPNRGTLIAIALVANVGFSITVSALSHAERRSGSLFSCAFAYAWVIVHEVTDVYLHERFEVFTAVTMKNAVFLDVTLCGSCNNRRFGGTYRLHNRVTRVGELRTTLAVTSNPRTLRRNTRGALVASYC
jgi:hypothetical protein